MPGINPKFNAAIASIRAFKTKSPSQSPRKKGVPAMLRDLHSTLSNAQEKQVPGPFSERLRGSDDEVTPVGTPNEARSRFVPGPTDERLRNNGTKSVDRHEIDVRVGSGAGPELLGRRQKQEPAVLRFHHRCPPSPAVGFAHIFEFTPPEHVAVTVRSCQRGSVIASTTDQKLTLRRFQNIDPLTARAEDLLPEDVSGCVELRDVQFPPGSADHVPDRDDPVLGGRENVAEQEDLERGIGLIEGE